MKKINYLKIVAFIILISLFIVFIVNTILKFSIKRSSTLDSENLLDIEHFLDKVANNGFINHTYDDASMIDISEILYYNTYIGNIVDSNSSEYEYLVNTVFNGTQPTGDILTFDPLHIKILYFEKTGLDISQNSNPNIQLKYCKTYASSKQISMKENYIYCYAYSDTHHINAKCLSGNVNNGIYHIIYCDANTPENQYEVTLKKSGNGYIFIQNKKI